MKIDSPLFDRIRVKPEKDRRQNDEGPTCEWQGCTARATHRAPKGRNREREYWRYCLDHVREYNNSYNYFAGMSDDAVAQYQKDALTGHRPTWKMGMGGTGTRRDRRTDFSHIVDGPDGIDPFGVFAEMGGGTRREAGARAAERRTVRNAERKALNALGLEETASSAEIKARYKLLVKRHHPDANGGDRGLEDRLREIIQAYKYLKSVGWV